MPYDSLVNQARGSGEQYLYFKAPDILCYSKSELRKRRRVQAIETRIEPEQPMVDYINRLPEELLSTIFHETYPIIDCNQRQGTKNLGTLSKVCRTWNAIICTHGKLWSTIHLEIRPYPSFSFPPPRLELAKRACTQSHSTPISIRCTTTDNENTRKYEKAFEVAFSISDRWLEVHLDGLLLPKMVHNNPSRWKHPDRPMHLLRRLAFSRANHCDTLLGTFMGFTTGYLPRLTALRLEKFTGAGSLAGGLTSRGFPWSQITHLELINGPINGFSESGSIDDLFRQTPHLVSLTMTPLRYYPRRSTPPPPMKHLHTLILSFEGGDTCPKAFWPRIMSFLNTPHLTTLSIEAGESRRDVQDCLAACLPPFLETSGCSVQRLSLLSFHAHQHHAVLPLFPSVDSLFLNAPRDIVPLHVLTWKQPEGVAYLPYLSNLSISVQHLWSDVDLVRVDALDAIAESRAANGCPLRALDIRYVDQKGHSTETLGSIWRKHSLKGGLWPGQDSADTGGCLLTNWFPSSD